MPKLILVDGFAGSGKSTTAQRLWLDLTRAGVDARWFHEHELAHPIFQYGEVEDLLREQPARFARRLPGAWRDLAASAGGADIVIIEGAFLQIPVGVMLAMGQSAARIRTLLRQIDAALAGADASLVYLFRPNLRRALERLGGLRGPHWLTSMAATLAASPYGRRHGVKSVRGLFAFYERQRAIVESELPRLRVKRLSLDVTAARWDRYHRDIAAFTGVRPIAERPLSTARLLAHAGVYRSASGLPAAITTDGRRLYAQLPATRPLPLVQALGYFCAESLPIDVRFSYDARGRARRFTYESRMSNEVLADTTWIRA